MSGQLLCVRRNVSGLMIAGFLLSILTGCAEKKYVRGSEKEGLDRHAMSLKFDKRDINTLYNKTLDSMMNSSVVQQWEQKAQSGEAPVVAVFPMRNETSEHIGPQLDTLLAKFETDLVNKTPVSVVSHESQQDLIAEIKRQQSDAYNPQRMADYGRQLGAQYFVTGKVRDVAERVEGERRVQYFMFIQVLDVETGAIKFQNEAQLTKGFVK